MTATPRQTFALFCATGYDVRNCGLSKEQASFLIGLSKTDKDMAVLQVAMLPGAVQKKAASVAKENWQAVYDEARQAGLDAGTLALPTPMTVVGDAPGQPTQVWHVSEGACGFAWVTIFPGNCSFAKWLKKNNLASPAYKGGMQIWVHDFNQSIERKEKYAYAFAEVLTKHGIKAHAGSRLD